MREFIRLIYLWACERLYHEFAWSYDWVSWLVSFGRWSAWRSLALAEVVGEDVLELGFGTGALLSELSARGFHVTGLEHSPEMHRVAARRLAATGHHVSCLLAAAQAMPLADHRFDTVLSTFPAPYILESSTLQECRRVLRANGRLVIVGLWVTPRSQGLRRLLPVFYAAPSRPVSDALRERLRRAGFQAEIFGQEQGGVEVSILVAHVRPVDQRTV